VLALTAAEIEAPASALCLPKDLVAMAKAAGRLKIIG
jgi:hypothetical protein